MRPDERMEEIIRKADCEAPEALRRRLWGDVAEELHEAQGTMQRRTDVRVWRILASSRMARLAVAAVVVAGALAVGVERWTRRTPHKMRAYGAEIRANTALDLDPEAALPLRDAQPGDFDVTWSSEDGGSLKILPGASLRILACPYINTEFDGAVSWSYANLAKLRESTFTRVVPKKRERFAVVLTSEGNLAVIEIGGYDEEQAWLSWRIETTVTPGYSATETVTLRAIDPESNSAEEGAIDLDTGRVVSIPAHVLNMPAMEMQGWLEQNGVDAIARKTNEGYGLVGVGLVSGAWPPGSWASTDAVDLREQMASRSFQLRRPVLYRQGQYQQTFPFKTREGGIGMLQMLAVDAAAQTMAFRYKMVEEEPVSVSESVGEEDPESARLAESVDKLMRFAIVLMRYGDRHDRALPGTLGELKEYVEECGQDYQWIVENVGYVGKGARMGPNPSVPVAFDKTLAARGKGTFVLYSDPFTAFWNPEELEERGIVEPTPATPR